jgi:polyisoprenyl-teichoic acid--peptidoglycan teichoic acid transferase
MIIRQIKTADNRQKRRKIWKRFFWGVVVLIFGVAGWIGVTGVLALKNITAKNISELPSFFKFGSDIDPAQLTKEGDSRINVLLLGVDDAAGLTDSIQIASLDPINNRVAMLAVPRDLQVMNPAKNRRTKINEVYRDNSKRCPKPIPSCNPSIDYGAEVMEELLGNLLGIKISHFVRIDFQGLERAVDTLGGIRIYVDKPLSDPAFPNRSNTGYEPFSIAAGTHTLNGRTALRYSRCRGGNCGGDFGRAKRQQQVLVAIKDKAMSLGILANPQRLTSLMSATGQGLRTDFQTDQLAQLYKVVSKIDTSQFQSAVMDNGPNGVLKNSTAGGSYILVPRKGVNDWSEVRDYVASVFPEPYLIKENAPIIIKDASGTGTLVAERLKKYGYNVIGIEVAETTQTTTTITYRGSENRYTLAFLKRRFSVTPVVGKESGELTEAQIVITIGSSYKTN